MNYMNHAHNTAYYFNSKWRNLTKKRVVCIIGYFCHPFNISVIKQLSYIKSSATYT